MQTTRVYIDGFNLYHGLIQGQGKHWLDLSLFAMRLNRGEPVDKIRLITQELGKTVWVRNPRDKSSEELESVSSSYDRIRPAVALASQLPDSVSNGAKTYRKPARWSQPSEVKAKKIINSWVCSQADCGKWMDSIRYE